MAAYRVVAISPVHEWGDPLKDQIRCRLDDNSTPPLRPANRPTY